MLLVQGQISQKYGFQMCLLTVLGSQGIVVECTVVECTAAIFFPSVDCLDGKHNDDPLENERK